MLKDLWHGWPLRKASAPEPLSELSVPVWHGAPDAAPAPVPLRPQVRGRGPIELKGVKKLVGFGRTQALVLKGIDAVFPRGRAIGILGGPGSGKSTLMQMLNGNYRPDGGTISHGMTVSWMMSGRDTFRKELSIRSNIRLLCTLYGAWAPDMIEAVKEIGKIRDRDLDTPINLLAADFTSRAAVSLCYAMDFDCYVSDDLLCGGPKNFRAYIKTLMLERQKTHSLIIATKNAASIRDLCDDFYILEDGVLKTYGSRRETFKAFTGLTLTRRLDPRGEADHDEQ